MMDDATEWTGRLARVPAGIDVVAHENCVRVVGVVFPDRNPRTAQVRGPRGGDLVGAYVTAHSTVACG